MSTEFTCLNTFIVFTNKPNFSPHEKCNLAPKRLGEWMFLQFLYHGNEMVKGEMFCRAASETDGPQRSFASPCGDLLCSPRSEHWGPLKVSLWKAHFHFYSDVIQ